MATKPKTAQRGTAITAIGAMTSSFADDLADSLFLNHGIDRRCISHDEVGGTVTVKIGDSRGVFVVKDDGAVAFVGWKVPGMGSANMDSVWRYMAGVVDQETRWF